MPPVLGVVELVNPMHSVELPDLLRCILHNAWRRLPDLHRHQLLHEAGVVSYDAAIAPEGATREKRNDSKSCGYRRRSPPLLCIISQSGQFVLKTCAGCTFIIYSFPITCDDVVTGYIEYRGNACNILYPRRYLIAFPAAHSTPADVSDPRQRRAT